MKYEKHPMPQWCREAKKALIDRDMGIKDLAGQLGLCREHVSAVINDRVRSPNTKRKICNYLGLDEPLD